MLTDKQIKSLRVMLKEEFGVKLIVRKKVARGHAGFISWELVDEKLSPVTMCIGNEIKKGVRIGKYRMDLYPVTSMLHELAHLVQVKLGYMGVDSDDDINEYNHHEIVAEIAASYLTRNLYDDMSSKMYVKYHVEKSRGKVDWERVRQENREVVKVIRELLEKYNIMEVK